MHLCASLTPRRHVANCWCSGAIYKRVESQYALRCRLWETTGGSSQDNYIVARTLVLGVGANFLHHVLPSGSTIGGSFEEPQNHSLIT